MLEFLTFTYSVDPTSSVFVGDTQEDADAAGCQRHPFCICQPRLRKDIGRSNHPGAP